MYEVKSVWDLCNFCFSAGVKVSAEFGCFAEREAADDAWTHEIIGWMLSDSLMASNTIAALKMGIEYNKDLDLSGLIHHSDRGSQYCSNAYVDMLKSVNASISMTEDYKPTDNAIAERVNGTIKQEWLYRMKRPKNLDDAYRIIRDIVDFYNNKRPHMSN